jgi:hypothetical protein
VPAQYLYFCYHLIFLILIRKIKKMSIHSLFCFAAKGGERLLKQPPLCPGDPAAPSICPGCLHNFLSYKGMGKKIAGIVKNGHYSFEMIFF